MINTAERKKEKEDKKWQIKWKNFVYKFLSPKSNLYAKHDDKIFLPHFFSLSTTLHDGN
jgi:hypothetical protein